MVMKKGSKKAKNVAGRCVVCGKEYVPHDIGQLKVVPTRKGFACVDHPGIKEEHERFKQGKK
jgi:hypothetical protein